MASTFTLASHSWGGRYMYLECSQSKDIATNKSTISWKLSSLGGEVNYYATEVTLTIGGTVVYQSGRVAWDSYKFPAAKGSTSGTIDISHDEYGNKTINVVMTVMIYDGVPRTQSVPWELDNIPRQATITDYPKELKSNGNPPTIKYSNPAGNNVTSLDVCIADDRAWNAYVGYRSLDKAGKSYTFTAADMEALKALSSKTLGITFVIRTVIGGVTLFSATQTSTFTMVEDETTKPSVDMSVALDNGSLPSKFDGLWIQGKSRAEVSVTTAGKYNASITSITTRIGNDVYTTNSFKSNVIDGVGKVSIIAMATDTRSFTGTASEDVDVIEYSKPLVIPIGSENSIQCYRSDGNSKRVGNSTSLWIKAKRSYHKVNSINQCALQWRYKLSTDTWDDNTHLWTDLISKTITTTDEYNALLSGVVFDLKKSYTVQIRAIDDIGEYDPKEFDIPTQDVALHLGKGGKNVSVGTYCDYSEEYTFYSDWKAIFDKGIKGTMIQQAAADVFAFAEGCAQGFTPFFTAGDTTNVPSEGNYLYASGFVCKRSDSQITVVIFSYYSGDLAINTYYDTAGGWLGWRYIHTTTT